MHQLSDKDLDRLSKEASEQVDPELSAPGWESLESLLDKELPQSKKDRRRFLFLLALIVLLSGAGLIWTMISSNPTDLQTKNVQRQQSLNSTTGKQKSLLSTEENTQPKQSLSAETTQQKTSSPDESAPQKTPSLSKEIAVAKLPSATIRNSPSIKKNIDGKLKNERASLRRKANNTSARPLVKDKIKSENNIPSRISRSADNPVSPDNADSKNKTASSPIAEEQERNKATEAAANLRSDKEDKIASETIAEINSGILPEHQIKNQSANTDTVSKTTPFNKSQPDDSAILEKSAIKTPKKIKSNQKLIIGIVAGPDVSAVKNNFMNQSGFNTGLLLGYKISDRWSLHSGALYTKKKYAAKGKDFHPPKNYWINNVYLHQLEGDCSMFDIPINVRYAIPSGKKHNLFFSAGLSTYLMNKETYRYDYTLNGIESNSEWTNNKNSAFLFSILNVSAGFEKKINNTFSIQAEPYLKAPLKGIGFGNMQLNSYGIYFSLIYKPSFK